MFGYRVPAPDEAMLISGGKSGRDGTPFRVVTGHGEETTIGDEAPGLPDWEAAR